MPTTCVLNADQTDAPDKTYLTKRITELRADKLTEVCRALALATSY
jgi:mRNA-degrading endonuclease toxin of MazEF toxin-antitoxin module